MGGGGSHVGKVFLRQQHDGLTVVVLGGIVVLHLKQTLIYLVSAVLLVDFLNNNLKVQMSKQFSKKKTDHFDKRPENLG